MKKAECRIRGSGRTNFGVYPEGRGILPLGLEDTAPARLTAAFFGAFSFVLLDGRQPIFIVRSKNPSKNAHCEVQSSFHGAAFCRGKENSAENTFVFSRRLTQHRRNAARENRTVSVSSKPDPSANLVGRGRKSFAFVKSSCLLQCFPPFDGRLCVFSHRKEEGFSISRKERSA